LLYGGQALKIKSKGSSKSYTTHIIHLKPSRKINGRLLAMNYAKVTFNYMSSIREVSVIPKSQWNDFALLP
jgi:hypothetical protein